MLGVQHTLIIAKTLYGTVIQYTEFKQTTIIISQKRDLLAEQIP